MSVQQRRLLYSGVVSVALAAGLVHWRKQCLENRPPLPKRLTATYVTGRTSGSAFQKQTLGQRIYALWRLCVLVSRTAVFLAKCSVLCLCIIFCSRRVVEEKLCRAVVPFLTSLGPTYIKLGQWLASRPDMFPKVLCNTLKTLLDRVPAHDWRFTQQAIGIGGLEGVLSSIERSALNSGSIAQVHKAVLAQNTDGVCQGQVVVVKVLHPHIRELIAADLSALHMCVTALEAVVPSLRCLDGRRALGEFGALMQSQLDLRSECDNLLQFRYNFRDFDGVVFPQPMPSLCSSDILVETFEEGTSLHAYDARENEDGECLADIGCHMFLKMLFEDNFVHSDLHAGNLLVRKRLQRKCPWWQIPSSLCSQEIVVLDPGLVTTLSPQERENFISLFACVACGDGKLGAELMIDRKSGPQCSDRNEFIRKMEKVFDVVGPKSNGFRLSNVDISVVLCQVLETVRSHGALIDGNFAALVVTVVVGEALGRHLAPDFNIFAASAPYMMKYLEGTELLRLVDKLQETYGATTLLADTFSLERTPAYLSVAQSRALETLDWVSLNFFVW